MNFIPLSVCKLSKEKSRLSQRCTRNFLQTISNLQIIWETQSLCISNTIKASFDFQKVLHMLLMAKGGESCPSKCLCE